MVSHILLKNQVKHYHISDPYMGAQLGGAEEDLSLNLVELGYCALWLLLLGQQRSGGYGVGGL